MADRPMRDSLHAAFLVFAGALIGVSLVACTGLRDLEAPDVFVTAIRPLDATLLEQRFEVDLRIYNPNNRDLDIDGVDFELVVNDSRLARGSGATELILPRLGEAETTVRVSTTFFDVARQIMNAGQSGVISYRLSGRVHLGTGLGGSLPFEKSGTLEATRQTH
ncbi:MAG: LEA type 2 family protein [Gammaproteobacteria bacterium]